MSLTYADYAAATPTDPAVVTAMAPFWTAQFGNPSSVHSLGKAARQAIEQATQTVAKFLNAAPHEIYFTSSGTESNNLAILGVAKANRHRGQHIVTSTIEHPSVLNACRALERDGFSVTYAPVKTTGQIDSSKLLAALSDQTILVSLHLANSEIGVVQDIAALARAIKRRFPETYIHVDACQASPFLELNVQKLGVDLLTINGSKMYGPKGIAVLYVRSGVPIFPLFYGGGQQQSLRSGTENVPGIAGLAKAIEVITQNRAHEVERISRLRDELQEALIGLDCQVNALDAPRLPNHLSVTLPDVTNRNLVAEFDRSDVALSSGSACSSRSKTDSHVLQALGLTSEAINATVRISLGRLTTAHDIKAIVSACQKILAKS